MTYLITAGPTIEDIDPVRFAATRLNGKCIMTKRRFQFHFSTALIAMVVSGTFLGLSVLNYAGENVRRNGFVVKNCGRSFGWPFVYFSDYLGMEYRNAPALLADILLCLIVIYFLDKLVNKMSSNETPAPTDSVESKP